MFAVPPFSDEVALLYGVVAPVGSKKKSRAATLFRLLGIFRFWPSPSYERPRFTRAQLICCVSVSVFVTRPRMDQDQPSIDPSPGSMKLSRVTKFRAMRWKLGVTGSPKRVSEGSPFE